MSFKANPNHSSSAWLDSTRLNLARLHHLSREFSLPLLIHFGRPSRSRSRGVEATWKWKQLLIRALESCKCQILQRKKEKKEESIPLNREREKESDQDCKHIITTRLALILGVLINFEGKLWFILTAVALSLSSTRSVACLVNRWQSASQSRERRRKRIRIRGGKHLKMCAVICNIYPHNRKHHHIAS